MINEELKKKLETVHKLEGNYATRQIALDGAWITESPSQKLRNHSPDSFAWGYSGSGPAQTSLAICLKLLGKDLALKIYQDFKFNFISILPRADFEREFRLIDHIPPELIGEITYVE